MEKFLHSRESEGGRWWEVVRPYNNSDDRITRSDDYPPRIVIYSCEKFFCCSGSPFQIMVSLGERCSIANCSNLCPKDEGKYFRNTLNIKYALLLFGQCRCSRCDNWKYHNVGFLNWFNRPINTFPPSAAFPLAGRNLAIFSGKSCSK